MSRKGNLLKGQLQGLGQAWDWNPGFWPHQELGHLPAQSLLGAGRRGMPLVPPNSSSHLGVLEASCRSCLCLLRHLLKAGLMVSGILMLWQSIPV